MGRRRMGFSRWCFASFPMDGRLCMITPRRRGENVNSLAFGSFVIVQLSAFTFLSALRLLFLRAGPHAAAPRHRPERCLRTLARFAIRPWRNPGAIVLAPRARSYAACLLA